LVKRLRRANEQYRDPGAIAAIVKRYQHRGQLTEDQARDFLSAAHVGSDKERREQRQRR
jgi:hypothetical protein